jgi:hypothetical protein
VRRRNPRGDKAAVIDSLILTVGFALLSWVFLIAPNVHLSGLDWLAKGVSVAYPVGDVLLLAAVIRLAVNAGRRVPAFYLLVASIVSLLATDCAYNYALLKGTYNHQLVYDIGWIAYLAFCAALHPMRMLTAGRRVYASHSHPSRTAHARVSDSSFDPVLERDSQPRRDRHHHSPAVLFCSSSPAWPASCARRSTDSAERCAAPRFGSANEGDGVHDAVIAAVREIVSDPGAHVRLLPRSEHSVVVASSDLMREPAH